ncbi:MAG: DEAD/DEAH box helicase [Verrucomicrobiae bacterium]|nr:DEAD/DEAH box helicase [Verrucomicrobiae bacterium]
MSYSPGNIVSCRGREWVVMPDSQEDLLMLKPLGGTDDEIAGVYLPLEQVETASFDLPSPDKPGDYLSCQLLRDAVRLSVRASAGPFRSFGRIAVEPRPYQLVPLLMALRLDPIRLLIADDVGIGKTVEALLIARELFDRGEIQNIAVLCPPHLAEQWQEEMREKFHLDAELVLSGTAKKLERDLGPGETIFDRYPVVIVSLDYIKARARRDDFVRACPKFVIVDEAHTCSDSGGASQQQRHQLVAKLGEDQDRHLVLVTATPHSGKEHAFRSLLSLINPEFGDLPPDLSGEHNRSQRERLARHLVQRRRENVRDFMDTDTMFPTRYPDEADYALSKDYGALFNEVLNYTRELVADRKDDTKFRQRVRWWSALALLRTLASSPAAAAATMRNRAKSASATTAADADELGRQAVLDMMAEDSVEGEDVNPGADWSTDSETSNRKQLLDLADHADTLRGDGDPKLIGLLKPLKKLLADNFNPILFCRFIDTAEYLGAELRERLPGKIEVEVITGRLAPSERENRIAELGAREGKKVLVCTDCLSEGVNLQQHFNAVVHYDLAWNPTRHEQREGRVDRFGQPSKDVRVLTYYGRDNRIDGIVLEILIRKHSRIRSDLGISIPIPVESDQVIEAVMEGLLLREKGDFEQMTLSFYSGMKDDVDKLWDKAAEAEDRSRNIFRQESIKPEAVLPEWQAMRAAIGDYKDVRRFVTISLEKLDAVVRDTKDGQTRFVLDECAPAVRDALPIADSTFNAVWEPPAPENALWLSRSHPVVGNLASYVIDTASDPAAEGSIARRAGVVVTSAVSARTVLLLLRFRYHIVRRIGDAEDRQLVEECQTVGFTGLASEPQWLTDDQVEAILQAKPEGNIPPDLATHDLERLIARIEDIRTTLNKNATARADQLLAAHRRVRDASRSKGRYEVETVLPVDILGIYIYQKP